MDWGLLISQPDTPWINMGTDECLLQWVGQTGRPIMRFYSWDREAVSFGYFQAYEDIASWTPVRPLVRRPTGGGLVSHVADWTYSVAIPDHHEWYRLKACESYCLIHRWVNQALNDLNIPSKLANQAIPTGPGQCFLGAEENDILLNGFKIAGAAQRRTRKGLLIQGSIQIPDQTIPDRQSAWSESMRETGAKLHGIKWGRMSLDNQHKQTVKRLVEEKFQTEVFLKRR